MGFGALTEMLAVSDTVLTDAADLAETLNVRAVRGPSNGKGPGMLFGHQAEAFHHWVARQLAAIRPDLAIVSRFEREALLVRSQGVDPDVQDPRWIRPLARLVRTYSGTPRWQETFRAGALPDTLAERERETLSKLEGYYALLQLKGRIELGDAAMLVARSLVGGADPEASHGGIAYVSDEPLSPIIRSFADLLRTSGEDRFVHLGTDGRPWTDEPIDGPRVEGALARTSSSAATPSIIVRSPRSPREQLVQAHRDILALLADGPVRVCSKDPTATYEALAPLLALEDMPGTDDPRPIRVVLRSRARFRDGAYGRHLLAQQNVLRGTRDLRFGTSRNGRELPWDKASQSDALTFDRFAPAHPALWHIDANWRQRLLISKDEAWEGLGPESFDPHPPIDGYVDPTVEFSGLEFESPNDPGGDPQWNRWVDRWEASRRTAGEARGFLASLDWKDERAIDAALVGLLGTAPDGGPVATYDGGLFERPDVEFRGLSDAADPSPEAPTTLIALDLDADSFPTAEREGAVDGLVERLGLPPEDTTSRSGRLWHRLLAVASGTTVLSCPQRDEAGNALRCCEFLEDLVTSGELRGLDGTAAIQRTDPRGESPVSGLDELAETLWPSSLVTLAAPPPEPRGPWSVGPDGAWGQLHGPVGPMEDLDPRAMPPHAPREIRTYLDCPRKWFWESRLTTFGLDASFDAMARSRYLKDAIIAYTARRENLRPDSPAPTARKTMADAMQDVQVAYHRDDDDLSGDDPGFPRYLPLPGSVEEARLREADRWLETWPDFASTYLQPRRTARRVPGFRHRFACVETETGFRYLSKFLGAIDGMTFTIRPFRLDCCLEEGTFLVTMLEGSLASISFEEPVTDGSGEPDVAGLPASMVQYCALLQMMGHVRSYPMRWPLRLESLRPAGVVIVSSRDDHPVKGFCDAGSTFVTATELGDRPGIVCADPQRFERTLRNVESFVAKRVVQPIRRGDLPRRPCLAHACAFCGDRLCPMRRSHD